MQQVRTSLFLSDHFFSQDIDHCGADTYCCAPVVDSVWPSPLRHGVLSKRMEKKWVGTSGTSEKYLKWVEEFSRPFYFCSAVMELSCKSVTCLYFKAWVEVRIYWRFRLLFILEFSRKIFSNPCMPSHASYFHHRFEMFFSTQVVEKCTSGATCFATERCQRWTDGGSSENMLKQALYP